MSEQVNEKGENCWYHVLDWEGLGEGIQAEKLTLARAGATPSLAEAPRAWLQTNSIRRAWELLEMHIFTSFLEPLPQKLWGWVPLSALTSPADDFPAKGHCRRATDYTGYYKKFMGMELKQVYFDAKNTLKFMHRFFP